VKSSIIPSASKIFDQSCVIARKVAWTSVRTPDNVSMAAVWRINRATRSIVIPSLEACSFALTPVAFDGAVVSFGRR